MFLTNVIKAICKKLLFAAYNWDTDQIDILLYPIKAYIKADKSVCNCYNKTQKIIDKKWDYDLATYIRGRKFVAIDVKAIGFCAKSL